MRRNGDKDELREADDVTCPCTCCAAFHLPYTLTQLRRGVHPEKPNTVLHQPEQIATMVIPLTPKQANERLLEFDGAEPGERPFRWRDRGHHFTCRHWDEETRLCTIYPDRPNMCRDFPYGKGCQYGCGCEGQPQRGVRSR